MLVLSNSVFPLNRVSGNQMLGAKVGKLALKTERVPEQNYWLIQRKSEESLPDDFSFQLIKYQQTKHDNL